MCGTHIVPDFLNAVLTYRHELGMNYNFIRPDLIVGSCLQVMRNFLFLKHIILLTSFFFYLPKNDRLLRMWTSFAVFELKLFFACNKIQISSIHEICHDYLFHVGSTNLFDLQSKTFSYKSLISVF